MTWNIAFAGFRHNHIFSLYNRLREAADFAIVGSCEEDAATRTRLAAEHPEIDIAFDDFDRMLDALDCDIVAVGDYYAKRGGLALRALERGKHVIADKPLCASLKELTAIERLAAAAGCKVGCMYELRSNAAFQTARKLIGEGKLGGGITQIQFGGQHPLLRGSRPAWYFEPGKHGGVINDIACHGIDAIRFLAGLTVREIRGARAWAAFCAPPEALRDAGQFMLELDNGAGVLGDVSYAAPDSFGFALPTYWRFNLWGPGGMMEFSIADPAVRLYRNGAKEVELCSGPADRELDYLANFRRDLRGEATELDTAAVLAVARAGLEIQACADLSAPAAGERG